MKLDDHITERINKEDKKIFRESKGSLRDMIIEHNKKYLKTTPKGLLLQIEKIEKEIDNNNEKIAILQKENTEKEINIQAIKEKIEKTTINIEDQYNLLLIKSIKEIIKQFESTNKGHETIKDYLNSKNSTRFGRLVEISNRYSIPLENLKELILKIYNE